MKKMIQDLLLQMNDLFAQFNEFAKASPVVAGIMGLWGASIMTFFLRGIPSRIWGFITRQSTTTLVLNNHDNVYYSFLRWTTENNFNSLVRTLHFGNSKSGHGKNRISIGYGTSYFIFNKRPFRMVRSKEEASQTREVKETIYITAFGRSHRVFDKLFKEIAKKEEEEKDTNFLNIRTWRRGYWDEAQGTFKRDLSTIILGNNNKEKLLAHIDNFIDEKDWYIQNGIPYRTGILLTGPPGTGKTSLLKGLCTYYEKDLYLLQLTGLTDDSFLEALSEVPAGDIIAIEDIDACSVTKSRKEPKQTKSNNLASEFSALTLSGLLNGIDGVSSGDDRILIATTNHPEKLDKALIREGRFDLKLNIGYVDDKMIREFFEKFYPDFKLPVRYKIKDKIAPCEVQTLIFENRDNPEIVLKKLKKAR
jgi:chaperone BCS1